MAVIYKLEPQRQWSNFLRLLRDMCIIQDSLSQPDVIHTRGALIYKDSKYAIHLVFLRELLRDVLQSNEK